MNVPSMLKEKANYKEPIWWLKNIISAGFLVVVIMCLYKTLCLNFVRRSFWCDEALLAESFSLRSLWDLTSGALENHQIAPVLWLYAEKIASLIFGNTESVVRSLSFVGYFTLLVTVYLSAKYIFEMEIPLAPVAFVGTVGLLMRYSNVFKPYIWDGALVLVVFLSYYLYKKQHINRFVMSIIWMILLWGSNPTCFFEGGILISEGLLLFFNNHFDLKKAFKESKPIIMTFVMIVSSFAVNYFYWLHWMAESDFMQRYWFDHAFPLFPTSMEDIKRGYDLLHKLYAFLCVRSNTVSWIVLWLIFVFIVQSFVRKKVYYLGVCFGFLVFLFASYIHMSPIQDRLCLFVFSLCPLMAFASLDWLLKGLYRLIEQQWNKQTIKYVQCAFLSVATLICGVFVASNSGLQTYADASKSAYWRGEELYPEIDYISENLQEDENVFVYGVAAKALDYIFKYDRDAINKWGNNPGMGNFHAQKNFDYVLNSKKCYILVIHPNKGTKSDISKLPEHGFLELVNFDYNTPMWYFYRNEVDSKLAAEIEVVSAKKDGSIMTAVIQVLNTGKAYVNHEFETVKLRVIGDKDYSVRKNIAPGAGQRITVKYPAESKPTFQLVQNENRVLAETNTDVLNKLSRQTARIDIKLNGKNAKFELLEKSDANAKANVPQWFQKGGKGYVVESLAGKIKLTFKVETDGKLDVNLRGRDVRELNDNKKRIPVWIDYTSFKFNGKEELNEKTSVWHDKSKRLSYQVKKGDTITVEAIWQPHGVTL